MIVRLMFAFALSSLAALLVPIQASAQSDAASSSPAPSPTPSRWQWSITPYLWLPTINGGLHFDDSAILKNALPTPPAQLPSGAEITLGPNDYLSNLNSALMVTAEGRFGNEAVFGDLMYMNMSTSKATVKTITGPGGTVIVPISTSLDTHLRSTVVTLGISASLVPKPGTSTLEGLLGLRNVNLNASADWSLAGSLGNLQRSGGAEKSEVVLTPIAGVRGRIQIGKHFYVPYYGDYGASGAFNTWQGILGIANEYQSGAVILAWRQLNYYQTGNPGALVQNLRLGGPALGWRFDLYRR